MLRPMQFLATIAAKSAIHRDWRAHSRLSGVVSGVLFRWDQCKRSYTSGPLDTEQVNQFRVRQDQAIELETVRVLPDIATEEVVEQQPPPETQQHQQVQQAEDEPPAEKPRIRRQRLT